jgi:two-component system sensor histidine kinase KdpD
MDEPSWDDEDSSVNPNSVQAVSPNDRPAFPRSAGWVSFRLAVAVGTIAGITFICSRLVTVNATTAGFAYLIAILFIATNWGLAEATVASISAVLCLNFYFFPPLGTFTIADPQNWVALLAFMITSIVGSQLAAQARQRAVEAIDRQRELGRLYALSRAILLAEGDEGFAQQIAQQIERIFQFSAVTLYDRNTGRILRAGAASLSDQDDRLVRASTDGVSFVDPYGKIMVSAIRLGGKPIGSLAVRGVALSTDAIDALCNLVAIGLERVRSQELAARAEAARQSDEIKSTLFDAIAHEFKTPLTSIKAAASSILSSKDTVPAMQRELITIVDEETDRLSALVTEAIQMARIEAGGIRLDKQPTSIEDLITGVLQQLTPALDGRDVTLAVKAGLPLVAVDSDLIEMVFRHLIDNAVKYSSPGAGLAIKVRVDGSNAIVSVADEGPGIPEHEQDRIFEKFYRSPQTRQQVPGTGMGLAIAREIVRLHNGDISVTSVPGRGSEFSITIPLTGEEVTT